MLLKFTRPDVLESALVEPSTGEVAYFILTRPHFVQGSSDTLESACDYQSGASRRTTLTDKKGRRLAQIGWIGSQPTDIVIGGERLSNMKHLFGGKGAAMSPKTFGVSTRFDSDYYWLASPETLTLLDYDANETKGQLHHSSTLAGSKVVPVSPFLNGNSYLEFESHKRASDAELIVTFILMEVLRRSRFANTYATQSVPTSPLSKTRFVQSAGEHLRRVGRGFRRTTV